MLLKTRFYLPPLRRNGVIREGLLQQLDDSRGGDLILVSAPAGYGKSTLLSQWLHTRPHSFAWLTLGQEHNVEDVFWRYTLSSIQQAQPDLGAGALKPDQPGATLDSQAVVVTLLNDLDKLSEGDHSNSAISLVFDDFHYIDNPSILEGFNLFLDHLPSSVRVLITTRDYPQLKLAKRRASGQLIELGSSALRFSEQEAVAFFQRVLAQSMPGYDNLDSVAQQFCEKAEGWVAGLQLIALSLKNPDDAQKLVSQRDLHKHIADYLFEEVYQGLPAETQSFLWVTALPGRFCAALCNRMRQAEKSAEFIRQLEQSDLFLVPLDNHRTWFRYHDLFRQFLLQRALLAEQKQRDRCVELALDWLQEQGYYQEALALCIEQQRWQDLETLIADPYVHETLLQQPGTLHPWLQIIPEDIRAASKSLRSLTGQQHRSRPLHKPDEHQPVPVSEHPLTQREAKVLQLIGEGLSNKAIADQLHISLNTLKVHIRNLYGKLGVENRSQALLKLQSR